MIKKEYCYWNSQMLILALTLKHNSVALLDTLTVSPSGGTHPAPFLLCLLCNTQKHLENTKLQLWQ